MDRSIQYTGQIPLETDPLGIQRNTMVAIAKLAQAVLGDGPIINGFDCTPTAPASLDVTIGPGEIYDLSAIDATDYSSLLADTDHNILKQGIELDPTTLTITPPTTSGFSRKYLVQIAFSEVDAGATVLPYYNSADPAHGWSGPGNTGVAQYTQRNGTCVIQLKAGTAAATGSETAPAVDAGFAPAWIITVDEGDTEINSGDIVQHPDAPIIPQRLPDIVSGGGGTVDPATSTPLMDGTASVGSQTKYARGDHRHPTDTSRAAASAIPVAATSAPLMDGSAAVGTSTKYARQDHKHPTDTTRAAASALANYALLSGATFVGDVNVLDQTDGDNSSKAANTKYVDSAFANLLGAVSFGGTDGMPFKWTFGDLIIQASVFTLTIVSTATNTDQAVTFPDAFPTGCLGVLMQENDSTPRGLDNLFCTKPTTTGFTATGRDENETGASRIFYVAIGH